MPKGTNQGARQRGFARTKVAFKKNHQPTVQLRRQTLAQALSSSLVG